MAYTLVEAVDKLFITQGIDKKRFFARYTIIASDVWVEVCLNILNVTKSVWLPIKQDKNGNYIEIPADSERIFHVSTTNDCDDLVPLYFNPMFHVEQKPTTKKCGCSACDCGGLCEELSSTTMTTKVMFTDHGTDYVEKKWIKVCPNGDVVEYRETPVKKFNDRTGDAGDYNEDYNNDYDIQNPFANYEIITETFQDRLCKLEVRPCGCPVTTIDNENLVLTHCGNYLNPLLNCCRKRCETFLPAVNPKNLGEVNISECGTRMYVRRLTKETDYLLLSYQSNGRCEYKHNPVPEKALWALWTGIDYRKKVFNGKFSEFEKREAFYRHEDAKNKLILFDNKLSLEFLADMANVEVKW